MSGRNVSARTALDRPYGPPIPVGRDSGDHTRAGRGGLRSYRVVDELDHLRREGSRESVARGPAAEGPPPGDYRRSDDM